MPYHALPLVAERSRTRWATVGRCPSSLMEGHSRVIDAAGHYDGQRLPAGGAGVFELEQYEGGSGDPGDGRGEDD